MGKVIRIKKQSSTAIPSSNDCINKIQKRRCACYCRVSTLQDEQELSYENQIEYYTQLLENDPLITLVGVYGDQGISGAMAEKRPGFIRLMDDCRKGLIDEIYTKSISRFTRNFSECLEYTRELKELGIIVHFEKEGISTDDPGLDMLLTLMAIVSQEEINSISQARNWSNEQRDIHGDPVRRAPYGYTRCKEAEDGVHKWILNKDEAVKIRKVFELFLAGVSQRVIANKMNEIEKAEGGTKNWSQTVIKNMLHNEAYIGDVLTSKKFTVDYLKKERKFNKGERKQYYIKNHHEPIIDVETFEKAQQECKRRRNK